MAQHRPEHEQFAVLIGPVARRLLGEPNKGLSSKTELRFGARGSMAVDLEKGVWHDHEANIGGGLLDLVGRETGRTESYARVQWLEEAGFHIERDHAPKPNGRGHGARFNIVKTYDYVDEAGKLLFQVCRLDPKDFRQRRPDASQRDGWSWKVRGVVRNVPYRLPEVIEAIAQGQLVYVVEGEKDADNLWQIGIPATTNAGGVGKWREELTEHFHDADVVVIEDCDPQKRHPKTDELMFHPDGRPILPGQDHAQAVAAALAPVAASVRVLKLKKFWPAMPLKGDVSDWLQAGHTREQLDALVDQVPMWSPGEVAEPPLPLISVCRPFPINEKTIPPRDWIIPGFLMRKQVTVLVAPSGAGKSLLTLQLGIACALHIEWGGWHPRQKARVLMINSEDDIDEMRRRLAALTHLTEFDQRELSDNFMLAEIPDGIVVAKFDAKTKTLVRTPKLTEVVATIKKYNIDVVFVDPFAETFEGDENSNSELKWAGVYWREVARQTNVAICLVHHTKKYATGMAGDVDAARGAGALIGIARIVSTIFPMMPKEAEAMLDEDKQNTRSQYFRYDDAKANLNLTSVIARWFRKETITLDNATADQPADQVGALSPWKPKGFLDGILEDQIIRFLQRVDRGILDKDGEPTGEFYTFDTRKGSEHEMSRYVGDLIMEFFKIKSERATKLLEVWRKNGRLVEAGKYRSPRTRKDRSRCLSELAPKTDQTQSKSEQPDLLQ